MPATGEQRMDYLDAVRVFALLLGVVFHASLSFMPVFIGWAVMDISTSQLVSVFVLISHAFRMEVFFFIAGLFTRLKLQKGGMKALLSSRILQLGIPFIAGWFLLRPLLVIGWISGAQSMRGEIVIGDMLVQSWQQIISMQTPWFIGTHLWFLYYLLVITALVLIVSKTFTFLPALSLVIDRGTAKLANWACCKPAGSLLLIVPTCVCLWFMSSWGVDTPDKSLIPKTPVLFLYAGCFVFGWLMHKHPNALQGFAAVSMRQFLMCFTAIGITAYLSRFEMQLAHPQYIFLKLAYMLAYSTMMWSLVRLTLGIFKATVTRSHTLIRYLADSAYWVYLIHLPVVVFLQIAFAELAWHWSIKLTAICFITVVLALLFYEGFVRSTFIGKYLNGRRQPRYLFRITSFLHSVKPRVSNKQIP